jgi:hypothetical protein
MFETPGASGHRARVTVINKRPAEAHRLCQLLERHGVAAATVGFREFLEPITALALLLHPRPGVMLLHVPAGHVDGCWPRVCVLRRLARLCGVPFVVTTSEPNLSDTAVGLLTATSATGDDPLESLAAAVARFVARADGRDRVA